MCNWVSKGTLRVKNPPAINHPKAAKMMLGCWDNFDKGTQGKNGERIKPNSLWGLMFVRDISFANKAHGSSVLHKTEDWLQPSQVFRDIRINNTPALSNSLGQSQIMFSVISAQVKCFLKTVL